MHKYRFIRAILPLLILLSVLSCKKEPDLIGIDLLPESDYLHMSYTDTSTIVAYTIKEDSLRTDELGTTLLGYLNDPVFGNTLASFYTQYRLPTNNVTFGTNAEPDSIVLTLVYSGIYGDSASQHTVKVYELADTIAVENNYYSFSTVGVKPDLIGQATFVPNLKNADSVKGQYMPPHLRIVLSQEFAKSIVNAGAETLSSNSYFQKVFKGLHVTAEQQATTPTGSILYFDLMNELSRVTIYYHNDADTAKSIKLLINDACARFNNYNHFDYAAADPGLLQQFSGDTAAGRNRLFVEAMGGTKVKIRIPYLKNIPEKANIAVNEALLIFTNENPENTLAPPRLLAMKARTKEGKSVSLIDEALGADYFGGRYHNKREYRFRITKYVQDRMRNPNQSDHGLVLSVTGASLLGNRVVLNGTAAGQNRVKLVIYYTLIE